MLHHIFQLLIPIQQFFYQEQNINQQNMEPSQQKVYIIFKQVSRQKEYVACQQGIFQGLSHDAKISQKDNQIQRGKKLFDITRNIYLKVMKNEIKGQNYEFTVRIYDNNNFKDVCIQGIDNLELLFKCTGHYSYINGLQQMVVSFRKIGQGAFAQVYQVVTNCQHRFALKNFDKKQLEEGKNKAAFYNEIDILKKLKSQYIVPFDYIFETQKAFYLKMQFLQMTLKQKCAGKLLIRQQKKYMRQMILALSQMKKKGIIHRDLKPENIMIRQKQGGEEECLIIDFGLATREDVREHLFVRCGTPGFLAPEIANCSNKKEKQTCAIDMFSLGCIFFKMITGHYLFGGKSSREVLNNNRKGIYNQAFFSRLSQRQNHLLMKMIDLNPKTRITPQQALKQPYFESDIDDSDEIAQEECTVNRYLKKISSPTQIKNMETINSSCSSIRLSNSLTSQAYKLKGRQSVKDSCLTFVFGNNIASQEETLRESSNISKLKSTKRNSSLSKTREKSKLNTSRFSKMRQDYSKII